MPFAATCISCVASGANTRMACYHHKAVHVEMAGVDALQVSVSRTLQGLVRDLPDNGSCTSCAMLSTQRPESAISCGLMPAVYQRRYTLNLMDRNLAKNFRRSTMRLSDLAPFE